MEVLVHQQLRNYLRAVGGSFWPHHLTLARLVARTLQLGRNALMQMAGQAANHHEHCLSYLIPALLLPGPVIIVTTTETQQYILHQQLPQLRRFFSLAKPVVVGTVWPGAKFAGVLLMSQAQWLEASDSQVLPAGIPTVIDDLEQLVVTAERFLTSTLKPEDWEDLIRYFPHQAEAIQDLQVKLIHQVFQHPLNPYGCLALTPEELDILHLAIQISHSSHSNQDSQDRQSNQDYSCLPPAWQLWRSMLASPRDHCFVAQPDRGTGRVVLQGFPLGLGARLKSFWNRQPLVLLGQQIELDPQAPLWKNRLGLDSLDFTHLAFTPAQPQETLPLYLPSRFPLPNTPEFAHHLQAHIGQLLWQLQHRFQGTALTVVIVDDVPLREQIAARLAAGFGSQVRVESLLATQGGILVCSGQFWLDHNRVLPLPLALLVATLPIPSREDPRVAAHLEWYKQQHRDWFREYLWPECLHRLALITAPIRTQRTLLTLFDTRIVCRSYGQDVLNLLSPYEWVEFAPACDPWQDSLQLDAP